MTDGVCAARLSVVVSAVWLRGTSPLGLETLVLQRVRDLALKENSI